MTKQLTTVDSRVLEVHFAREHIVTAPFSVTTPGWHNVWLLTRYGSAYANTDEVMLRSEAIVWSRNIDTSKWYEIDEANLIPMQSANKADAIRVVTHISHEDIVPLPDTCGVKTRQIMGYGVIYNVEEE